jgi:acyl-CoA synthetase (AMP-forming)/AMP-acid ligase II
MPPVPSPHPDVVLPDAPLGDIVFRRAGELGGRPALVDGENGRATAYDELAGLVDRVACGLAARGFGEGDVLAVMLPNVPEFVLAFQAAARLGGAVTPVNPLYPAENVAVQLRDSGARAVITVPQLVPVVREAGAEEVYALGGAPDAQPFESLSAEGTPPSPAVDPEQIVALPYSSGTVGLPKGVMLTHRNLTANLLQVAAPFPIDESDTVLALLPFFHMYGLTVNMNLALAAGATVVTMPRFELGGMLRLIEQHRVTLTFLVPPIVLALARHPSIDGADLSSLRTIVSGAAPLDAAVAAACAARIGCEVIQGYGLTETSPVTHLTPRGSGTDANPGSVGPSVGSTEVRVVDVETGADLPAKADGEVLVRGPQVMRGYLGNPQATADALDPGGWLHTGDIGHLDADGCLFVVDRLKELIKVRGLQVAPAELEALLLAHPSVADAAVVGLPDAHGGEIPCAYVVLFDEASQRELLDHVAARVPPHKRIRRVTVIDEIPRTPSGKILRRVLRERSLP